MTTKLTQIGKLGDGFSIDSSGVISVTSGKVTPVINYTNTPPATPSSGDVYATGSSPTGAWADHAYKIATYTTAWAFEDPTENSLIFNETNNLLYFWNGSTFIISSFSINSLESDTSAASDDTIPFYDTSTSTQKKITKENLLSGATIDVHSLTEESSVASGDEVMIYDVSASALRKMTRANFVSVLAGASSVIRWGIEGPVPETTLLHWDVPMACTITMARASLESPPSSYCYIQMMKNGLLETNSIFSADSPIAITSSTSAVNGVYPATGTLDSGQVSLAAGDTIWVRVNQADTGAADLLAQIVVVFT